MRLDGYIRVSRVRGREGDSFISPDVQRETIEAYAKAKGYAIGEWFTDLDKSGGTLDRPGFTAALERCRSGESDGIIAAKLDRISRSLSGLSKLIEESKAGDWTLVAVDYGLDVKSPNGKLVAEILGAVADWERARRTDDWRISREQAVKRGVHVSSRTPTGYRRREDGRLEPDPVAAPVIHGLFLRRAAGAGWTALAKYLDDSGIVGPYGSPTWRANAARDIITNPVYLGEARSGEFVNREAHEPLVDRLEWEAAQGAHPGPSPRNGEGLLLSGLIRCAGCRYLLKPDVMRDRDGSRLGLYRCRGRHAAGLCPSSASTLARVIDPYVEAAFLDGIGDLMASRTEADDSTAALAKLEAAEAELATYVDIAIGIIGAEAYAKGLAKRQAAVDEARDALRDATRETLPAMTTDIRELWPTLSIAERRGILGAAIDCVVLRAGRESIDKRVVILWRGQAPDDLPARGRRPAFRPFDELPATSWVA